ncbi:MAG: hypothetical protein U1A72_10835 [Sulfuritalea sp.]|nr:hypothetical protein [Sulfuritalea sp.]
MVSVLIALFRAANGRSHPLLAVAPAPTLEARAASDEAPRRDALR